MGRVSAKQEDKEGGDSTKAGMKIEESKMINGRKMREEAYPQVRSEDSGDQMMSGRRSREKSLPGKE